MAYNDVASKVIIGGDVIIDLTNDDVTAADVQSGKKFHLPNGQTATGTSTKDADTRDATAVAAEILTGKTAYKNGSKLTGTMPNRGSVDGKISTKAQEYTVQQGYHDGSGKVSIDSTEQAKIIPNNIREGITILGVEGTMSGSEDVVSAAANVTPSLSAQTILPGDLGTGVNYISQVNVAAIPIVVTQNSTGGYTYTIG